MELSTSHHVDGLNEWTMPRTKLKGESALQHLFNRLDGMYPGRWGKNFPGPVSIQNWKDECVRVFAEEGITLDQIAVGLRTCRRAHPEWPPSVPEFANACNPPVEPVAAYHEALAGLEARAKGELGAWSHPAIFWAASGMRGELASQPAQFMKERWAAALKSQLARGQWEEIPPPRVLLPAPGKSPTASTAAAIELAKLGAMGIMKSADSDIDHLRWARTILDGSGKKPPTSYQIKEARRALGIKTEEGGDEP